MSFLQMMGQLAMVLILCAFGLFLEAAIIEYLPMYWGLPVFILVAYLIWVGIHFITERKN